MIRPSRLLLAIVLACSATVASAADKPNIIYIMADDLGYGDLGCYGQQRIKTPAIDKMAAQGLLFTDHYAGSTVCAPSRCVLMTGLHTGHALVRNNNEVKPMGQMPLKPDTVTVAKLLKQGIAEGLFGDLADVLNKTKEKFQRWRNAEQIEEEERERRRQERKETKMLLMKQLYVASCLILP